MCKQRELFLTLWKELVVEEKGLLEAGMSSMPLTVTTDTLLELVHSSKAM
jgi:hypothetical protein